MQDIWTIRGNDDEAEEEGGGVSTVSSVGPRLKATDKFSSFHSTTMKIN
jgi:hypothetical protein